MMKKKNIIELIVLVILTMGSYQLASANWLTEKNIQGNGVETSLTRTMDYFSKIELDGPMKVILINGRNHSLTISGDSNIIPYIITDIQGGELKIYPQKDVKFNAKNPIIVTVNINEISQKYKTALDKLLIIINNVKNNIQNDCDKLIQKMN
jgi:hypothetical protein